MATYFEMNRDELVAEKAKLEEQYKKFQAMGLKLNMARGKPSDTWSRHILIPWTGSTSARCTTS